MSHPIPKDLKGEERLFTIPMINVHLGKKGILYNGVVTILAAAVGKLLNFWVGAVLFIILNIIAFPLAQGKIPKNRFEGGNVNFDKYLIRKFKYKKFNQNLYLRKRGN